MDRHLTEEEIAGFLEGTLSCRRRRAALRHMARCAPCLDELAELRHLRQAAAVVPDELLQRALQLAGRPESQRRVFSLRLALPVAALFVVAALLGYFFLFEKRGIMPEKKTVTLSDRILLPSQPAGVLEKKEVSPAELEPEKRFRVAVGKKAAPAKRKQIAAQAVTDEKDKEKVGGVALVVPAKQEADQKLNEMAEKRRDQSATQSGAAAAPSPQQLRSKGPATLSQAALKNQEYQKPVAPAPALTLAGDLTLADLLNPDIVKEFPPTSQPLSLELDVGPDGRVLSVVLPAAMPADLAARLRPLVLKMVFGPAARPLRKARLTFGPQHWP